LNPTEKTLVQLQLELAHQNEVLQEERGKRLAAEVIVQGFTALLEPHSEDERIIPVLQIFMESLGADQISILIANSNDTYRTLESTEANPHAAPWPTSSIVMQAQETQKALPLNTRDLPEWGQHLLEADGSHLSVLICPITTHGVHGLLVATQRQENGFTQESIGNWARLHPIACQVMLTAKQHEREHQMLNESQDLNLRLGRKTADLEQAVARERKLARLKDEFLSSMSHELRTPLNVVLGLNENLQEEIYGELNEKQKEALVTIDRSGRALLDLLNDLIDYTRLSANIVQLNVSELSIKQIVSSAILALKIESKDKGITIHHISDIDLPVIRGDAKRLKRCLIHLLQNAIKFSSRGDSVTVAYGLPASEQLVVSVADEGIGIKESFLKEAFEPLRQLDGNLHRKYSGTGLGLSLVSTVVELHHGGVNVASEEGVGSTFSLTLPV
jgi:signal transduction histidine kinase